MEISSDQLQDLRQLIEDTVEYYCDDNMLSGELIWTCVECLALAKQAELKGLVAA